jgi:hypothetical protein
MPPKENRTITPALNRPTEPTQFGQQRREWPCASGSPAGQAATRHETRRRFKPATVGFWLGGLVMGAGGCILGACLPSRHPVALVVGMLWWSLYLGCFGASVGALVGLVMDRASLPPSLGQAGADEPRPEQVRSARP